jgi:hypothetical protein
MSTFDDFFFSWEKFTYQQNEQNSSFWMARWLKFCNGEEFESWYWLKTQKTQKTVFEFWNLKKKSKNFENFPIFFQIFNFLRFQVISWFKFLIISKLQPPSHSRRWDVFIFVIGEIFSWEKNRQKWTFWPRFLLKLSTKGQSL